jgi:hypothetical protein
MTVICQTKLSMYKLTATRTCKYCVDCDAGFMLRD